MDEKTSVNIPAGHEWRFQVPFAARLSLRLVEGHAEMYGTELALGRDLEFEGTKAAIYSWQGGRIEWSGSPEVSGKIFANSKMVIYASLHLALQSQVQEGTPPVVLLSGESRAGKSTLARILCSYASKTGGTPLVVNLDPAQPVFVPPGTLTAATVPHILDVEAPAGWGSSPISGPSPFHPEQPVVYDFGMQTFSENPEWYTQLVELLGSAVEKRLARDSHSHAGVIIDAPSGLTPNLVKSVVASFGVTSMIVLGENGDDVEEVDSKVQVVKIERMESEEIDDAFVRQTQRRAIAQYFFGSPRQPLSPFTVTAKFGTLVVFRVMEAAETKAQGRFLTRVEPSAVLQNCLLAVVNARPTDDPAVVARAETLGFVHVVEADDKRQHVRLLLPVPGRIPDRPLIMGSFQYHE